MASPTEGVTLFMTVGSAILPGRIADCVCVPQLVLCDVRRRCAFQCFMCIHWVLNQEICQLGVNEKYEFQWTPQAQRNAEKFGDLATALDQVIGDGWRNLKSLANGVKTRLEKVPESKFPRSFDEKGYHTLWAIRSDIIALAKVACGNVGKYMFNCPCSTSVF